MEERERRIGRNEAVFREANGRIQELNQIFATFTDELVLVCECGDGKLAFDLYAARGGSRRGGSRRYLADAIMVLGLDSSAGIASVTAFREQPAFARFGLPDQIAR
jgi:hypothetical protein